MNLTLEKDAGVLKLSGVLDIDSADSLRDSLIGVPSDLKLSRIDLSAVEYCDVAALQVLVAFRKHSESQGLPLSWEPLSSAVADLAESIGLSLGATLAA